MPMLMPRTLLHSWARRRASMCAPSSHSMALVGGRHPLLEQQPDVAYQPNNTYLAGAIGTLHVAGMRALSL